MVLIYMELDRERVGGDRLEGLNLGRERESTLSELDGIMVERERGGSDILE